MKEKKILFLLVLRTALLFFYEISTECVSPQVECLLTSAAKTVESTKRTEKSHLTNKALVKLHATVSVLPLVLHCFILTCASNEQGQKKSLVFVLVLTLCTSCHQYGGDLL